MINRFARYLLRHSLIRFGIVGTAGYFVSAAILAFNTNILGLRVEAALFFSIFLGMCFTWLGNRYLTFAERRARSIYGAVQEWLKFMGANAVGAAVNYSTSILLVHFAPQPFDNRFVAQACGVLAGLLFNFTLSSKLVFKTPV